MSTSPKVRLEPNNWVMFSVLLQWSSWSCFSCVDVTTRPVSRRSHSITATTSSPTLSHSCVASWVCPLPSDIMLPSCCPSREQSVLTTVISILMIALAFCTQVVSLDVCDRFRVLWWSFKSDQNLCFLLVLCPLQGVTAKIKWWSKIFEFFNYLDQVHVDFQLPLLDQYFFSLFTLYYHTYNFLQKYCLHQLFRLWYRYIIISPTDNSCENYASAQCFKRNGFWFGEYGR